MVLDPGTYQRGLARYSLAVGVATGAFFVALFALVSIDFNRLFWIFHVVSFANDLWQLDPRTDYLVRMFPQGLTVGRHRLATADQPIPADGTSAGERRRRTSHARKQAMIL